MEHKKHRRRTRYTLMILSDSMENGIKQVYLGSRRFRIAKFLLAVVLIVGICYCVYNPIVLSGVRNINRTQAQHIKEIQEKNMALEAENKELSDKIAILSETINQKVQTETAQAAELAELSLPKGFPLTGAVTIQDLAEADEANPQGGDAETEEVSQEQEAVQGESLEEIMILKGTAGNMVVASGNGTVVRVESDAEYGNRVTIDHGNGYQSIYRNGGNARVKEGDEVVRGSTLFIVEEENTGLGYHITKDSVYINPEEMVEING